jgi:hypothetical protein
MLTKYVSGPDAELGAAFGVDPVADGNDGVEIVKKTRYCGQRNAQPRFELLHFLQQLRPDPARLPGICFASAWR